MGLFICWREWGLHFDVTRYRMCEKTFEAGELVIGPFWFVWGEWQ